MSHPLKIAVLPGDGIGLEVIPEAVKVLKAVQDHTEAKFDFREAPVGGTALREQGASLPKATLETCLQSDAVLLGALGDPSFGELPPKERPEVALLELRKTLGTWANLRPSRCFPALMDGAPLKQDRIEGADILVVRELTGGLYYGEPRGFRDQDQVAFNTMIYSRGEIERIARLAFELAQKRQGRLTSVDKSNALEVSMLWRRVVDEVASDFPNVELEHMYVDNCAMALVTRPASFDTILTENTFGDILSDQASVLTGSLGLLPSASVGDGKGLFEPVHGSAPDIAGQGRANPIATILTGAMLLRSAADLDREAQTIEDAVESVLAKGYRTADIVCEGCRTIGTTEMGDLIAREVGDRLAKQPDAHEVQG